MTRRHLLPVTLALALLSACQTHPHVPLLAVKSSTGDSQDVVAAANANEGIPEGSLVALSGQVMSGETPLANAQVVAKDVLTGKVLAGASSDASGGFTLKLPPGAADLVQVVATQGGSTLQALVATSPKKTEAKYVVTAASSPPVQVNWGTTLVAQLLGAKLAEVFVADASIGNRGREVAARAQQLAKVCAQIKASSLDQLRRESLASADVRKEVFAIVTEANECILAAFREGRGEIFEVSRLSVPDADLEVPAPMVTIDQATGKLTLTVGGKVETISVSRQALEGKGKAVIAVAASLAKSPNTGLVIPSQAELEQALANRSPASNRGGSSGGGSSSSGGGSLARPQPGNDRDVEPHAPKHKMWITDVQLAESGQSIKGADAAAALSFDPEGKPVRLKIKGKLNAEHPPKLDPKDFALEGFPFAGLIQQTFVGKEPKRRVMLDDSIWLPLDPNVKPTDTELTVILNSKALTDLAISNLHEIAVIDREDSSVASVRVANSIPVVGVQPAITKVEMVGILKFEAKQGLHSKEKDNDNRKGEVRKSNNLRILHYDGNHGDGHDDIKYLKVEGFNFPLSIFSHWAEVNGKRVYAHATWVTNAENPKSVLYLHAPEGSILKPEGQNQLMYANPFGFCFTRF